MNEIHVEIPLLHSIEETFLMGTEDNPIEYKMTRGFLEKHLPPKLYPIVMNTDYHGQMEWEEVKTYMEDIHNDTILQKIYREQGDVVGCFHKLTDSGNIDIAINTGTLSGTRLLDILKYNKVYVTFIFLFDGEKVIKIKDMKLCLGKLNERILFI